MIFIIICVLLAIYMYRDKLYNFLPTCIKSKKCNNKKYAYKKHAKHKHNKNKHNKNKKSKKHTLEDDDMDDVNTEKLEHEMDELLKEDNTNKSVNSSLSIPHKNKSNKSEKSDNDTVSLGTKTYASGISCESGMSGMSGISNLSKLSGGSTMGDLNSDGNYNDSSFSM
jgi:hypothetical protein